jgi:hypothetical protein
MAFFSCSRFLCGCSVTSFPSACLSVGASLLFSWMLVVIPLDSDSVRYCVAAEIDLTSVMCLRYDREHSTYHHKHSSRFDFMLPLRVSCQLRSVSDVLVDLRRATLGIRVKLYL